MNEIEQLQRSYKTAALLVAKFGNVYLPIFERMHNEMEKLRQGETLKKLALEIVKL